MASNKVFTKWRQVINLVGDVVVLGRRRARLRKLHLGERRRRLRLAPTLKFPDLLVRAMPEDGELLFGRLVAADALADVAVLAADVDAKVAAVARILRARAELADDFGRKLPTLSLHLVAASRVSSVAGLAALPLDRLRALLLERGGVFAG